MNRGNVKLATPSLTHPLPEGGSDLASAVMVTLVLATQGVVSEVVQTKPGVVGGDKNLHGG